MARFIIAVWCLLNISSALGSELESVHCLDGCPIGVSDSNPLLMRSIYTLSFNESTKVADWVAYSVSAGSIGVASSLSRSPLLDQYPVESLTQQDFIEPLPSSLSLGHLVPLVNFAGSPYWQDTNYMTARIAITSNLNRGAWYGLNWSIRNLVNRERMVYVLAGPLYEEDAPAMMLNTDKTHRVATAFFKVVRTESGQVSGFILDQSTPVHVHHCSLLSSIREIEERSGLVLFPDNPNYNFESLDARLGCESNL